MGSFERTPLNFYTHGWNSIGSSSYSSSSSVVSPSIAMTKSNVSSVG